MKPQKVERYLLPKVGEDGLVVRLHVRPVPQQRRARGVVTRKGGAACDDPIAVLLPLLLFLLWRRGQLRGGGRKGDHLNAAAKPQRCDVDEAKEENVAPRAPRDKAVAPQLVIVVEGKEVLHKARARPDHFLHLQAAAPKGVGVADDELNRSELLRRAENEPFAPLGVANRVAVGAAALVSVLELVRDVPVVAEAGPKAVAGRLQTLFSHELFVRSDGLCELGVAGR